MKIGIRLSHCRVRAGHLNDTRRGQHVTEAVMSERERIASQFEEHRSYLRNVAYRMLGSASDADDAVQEAWSRISEAETGEVINLRGWLTTVVARISLNMLRARKVRREAPIDDDQSMTAIPATGPSAEHEAVLADSVGLALLVVLERLTPAERLAFVLHDIFDLPFEEIAPIVERSPAAARQLASRARRRVQGVPVTGDADLGRRRRVVEAFLSASREGDFGALLTLLDPDIVVRIEDVARDAVGQRELRGAQMVLERARNFARAARFCRVALLNGSPGLVMAPHGHLMRALVFTFAGDKVASIEVIADPARLRQLDISVLEPAHAPDLEERLLEKPTGGTENG
jgi:RNA polymerase sigma factor (sigma-70 family)